MNPDPAGFGFKRHYPNTRSGKSLIQNACQRQKFSGFGQPLKTLPNPSIEPSFASLFYIFVKALQTFYSSVEFSLVLTTSSVVLHAGSRLRAMDFYYFTPLLQKKGSKSRIL